MATAEQVLKEARKYIGLVEKGNNNIIFNTAYYGHEVNGSQYKYCCVFCWYVFTQANAGHLFYNGKKTALCLNVMEDFKSKGRFYKNNPQKGDLVFFKIGVSQRATNHMGIVESVNTDGSVNTIEGNTSGTGSQNNGGMVMQKKRSGNIIVGYGRPAYDSERPPAIFQNVYPQKGIDISGYQTNVNYDELRKAGVKFAVLKIIRKDLSPDKMFEEHYRGCSAAGIPVRAVYNYSYATSVEKAKIDAHRVLEVLGDRKIPVVLDVEDDCQKNLGEKLIQIINAYQSVINSAGLKFCVYTGLYFYTTFIKPYLNKLSNTQFWIARYPTTVDMLLESDPPATKKPPVGGLIAWQYSSAGKIPSAYNGNLDFNILYAPIIEQTRKIGTCTANSLRIRTSPSTANNDNVVGYLKKGETVVIYATDINTGWYQIDVNGKQWVSNNYIQIQ